MMYQDKTVLTYIVNHLLTILQ